MADEILPEQVILDLREVIAPLYEKGVDLVEIGFVCDDLMRFTTNSDDNAVSAFAIFICYVRHGLAPPQFIIEWLATKFNSHRSSGKTLDQLFGVTPKSWENQKKSYKDRSFVFDMYILHEVYEISVSNAAGLVIAREQQKNSKYIPSEGTLRKYYFEDHRDLTKYPMLERQKIGFINNYQSKFLSSFPADDLKANGLIC